MTIRDAYGPGRFGLSFELFPPKTSEGMTSLFTHLDELVKFRPSYITCTFGAGGSTQDCTLEVIVGVRQKYKLPVATHLTCVGLTPPEIRRYLARAVSQGVENVVALRGDPPRGQTEFKPVAGGFSYANELVGFIRGEYPQLGVAVAGYPETHQEAPDLQTDLENLKRKVDARQPRRPIRSRRRVRHRASRRPSGRRYPRPPFLRAQQIRSHPTRAHRAAESRKKIDAYSREMTKPE
jgi:methylenetetrahydrofolate reductase (NADPH)